MKRNLKNISLLMLLATSSAQVIGMMSSGGRPMLKKSTSANSVSSSGSSNSSSTVGPKTMSGRVKAQAQAIANNVSTGAKFVSRQAKAAYNSAGTGLAQATGYQRATGEGTAGWTFQGKANKAGTKLAEATGYKSQANAEGWTFGSKATQLKENAANFNTAFRENLSQKANLGKSTLTLENAQALNSPSSAKQEGLNNFETATVSSEGLNNFETATYSSEGPTMTRYERAKEAASSLARGAKNAVNSAAGSMSRAIQNAPSAVAAAGRATYHAPGALVATVAGGNGNFITSNTGSVRSAVNATGTALLNAPANLRTAGNRVYEAMPRVSSKMTKAEFEAFTAETLVEGNRKGKETIIATDAAGNRLEFGENGPIKYEQMVKKLDSKGTVIGESLQPIKALSNLPSRTASSVARNLLSAKNAVMKTLKDSGTTLSNLSVSAKNQVTGLVNSAAKLASPTAAYNYVKSGLERIVGKKTVEAKGGDFAITNSSKRIAERAEFLGDQTSPTELATFMNAQV